MTPGPLSDPQSPGFPLCKASTTQGNTEMALTLCFTGRSAFILLTVLVNAHIALLLWVGKVKHRQVRSLPKVGLRQPGCRICALWHHSATTLNSHALLSLPLLLPPLPVPPSALEHTAALSSALLPLLQPQKPLLELLRP